MTAVLERLLFANSLRTTANHIVPMGLAHSPSLNLPCCSPMDRQLCLGSQKPSSLKALGPGSFCPQDVLHYPSPPDHLRSWLILSEAAQRSPPPVASCLSPAPTWLPPSHLAPPISVFFLYGFLTVVKYTYNLLSQPFSSVTEYIHNVV